MLELYSIVLVLYYARYRIYDSATASVNSLWPIFISMHLLFSVCARSLLSYISDMSRCHAVLIVSWITTFIQSYCMHKTKTETSESGTCIKIYNYCMIHRYPQNCWLWQYIYLSVICSRNQMQNSHFPSLFIIKRQRIIFYHEHYRWKTRGQMVLWWAGWVRRCLFYTSSRSAKSWLSHFILTYLQYT